MKHDYQDIEWRYNGQGVLTLSHNRPERRNAENQNLLKELDDALGVAANDPEIKVVILAGKGDHFSAGHDLKEEQEKRAGFSVEQRWAFEEDCYYGYALRIWDFPKPIIAQVQGACIAGGFMVAALCDMMVASDDAFFADPVCHTLAAAAVEVLIHPWVLGLRQAKDMLFTGRRIGAEEAFQMGLVNRVVPRAELEARTMELAELIATAPPFALKLVKRSLNRTAEIQGFRNSLQAHFDTHQLSHVTNEWREKVAAGLGNAIVQRS